MTYITISKSNFFQTTISLGALLQNYSLFFLILLFTDSSHRFHSIPILLSLDSLSHRSLPSAPAPPRTTSPPIYLLFLSLWVQWKKPPIRARKRENQTNLDANSKSKKIRSEPECLQSCPPSCATTTPLPSSLSLPKHTSLSPSIASPEVFLLFDSLDFRIFLFLLLVLFIKNASAFGQSLTSCWKTRLFRSRCSTAARFRALGSGFCR